MLKIFKPKLLAGACFVLLLCTGYSFSASATPYTVENTDIAITLDLGAGGISVTSIRDKINSFEYLTASSSLFLYAVNVGYGYSSNTNNAGSVAGVIVDSQTLSPDHKTLTIACHPNNANALAFTIVITTPTGSKAAVVSTTVQNTGGSSLFLKMITPNLSNVTCPGFASSAARMLGSVPQEIGEVVTLGGSGTIIGRPTIELTSQLPSAMNNMEVADIYDRDGTGGIFFADMDGDVTNNVPPVQFIVTEGLVFGNWARDIAASQTITLPRVAIGVHHSGDYHESVDFYNAAHTGLSYVSTPDWLKEAGAIWSTGKEGSGGAYEIWPQPKIDLNQQIASFDDLPTLYDQAVAQGTNVFYLNDYWEGNGTSDPRYVFKGDYIPRADLGGAAALTRGIAGIHAKGGKVVMYVEPFIITVGTNIANAHGREWAARDSAGNIWDLIPNNYVMMPNDAWKSYITTVAKRLVGTYGADGVFLDSWGERWNLRYKDSINNVMYTAQQWNKGVLDLADSVVNGMRTIKSDAIALSETFTGELRRHISGGSSADYVWDSPSNQGRIIASPVRYGQNVGAYFSSGDSIKHCMQVYAAGHGLPLNSTWAPYAAYLKRLLDIRRSYKDAMVYGTQSYQPATGTQWVGAYVYHGATNKVITMSNVGTAAAAVSLQLKAGESNSTWVDILNGDVPVASGTTLGLTVAGTGSTFKGLRVLVPNAVLDPGFEAQTTNTVSSPWTGTGNTGIDRNIGFQYAGLNEGYVIGTTNSKIYQNITVAANTNYNLTCFVQSGSGTTNGDFGIMVPGGAVIAHQAIGYAAAYTPITVSFNSGTNTTLQVYGSVGTGSPTPYVRFDNISLSLQ